MNTSSTAVETLVVTGTLTQADLLDMYANPVLVLGPPPVGATYMYVVHQFVMVATYNTAAFNAGGDIFLQYGNDGNAKGIAATTIIDGELLVVPYSQAGVAVGTTSFGALATMTGTGPEGALYITNASGAFTDGSAGSTATYYIYYSKLNVL